MKSTTGIRLLSLVLLCHGGSSSNVDATESSSLRQSTTSSSENNYGFRQGSPEDVSSLSSHAHVDSVPNRPTQQQKLTNRQLMESAFSNDICMNGPNNFGGCDWTRFPDCGDDESICFNRKPFRDRFHDDNRQPLYYIDYDLVLCYPLDWNSCSSCTPGRYCVSEHRCILDEVGYACAEWL